jgi:high-affinity iron transporter
MFEEIASFLPSSIITFRETLEAALIIGIVLAFLYKTQQTQYSKYAYWGVIAAVICSIAVAGAWIFLIGEFEGVNEQLFEGTMMIVGAALISWMIFWMMQQRHITQDIENEVKHSIEHHNAFAIGVLVFISVLREGVETVIFLGTLTLKDGVGVSMLGAAIGIVIAAIFGYALFRHFLKIKLKTVFNVTSILLILFAAGLVAHGVHEFEEAGVVPIVIEHVWDINPPLNADGTYPLLHEKGIIGGIAVGLFGYNGNPSLIEVLAYLAFIALMCLLWQKYSKPGNDKKTFVQI